MRKEGFKSPHSKISGRVLSYIRCSLSKGHRTQGPSSLSSAEKSDIALTSRWLKRSAISLHSPLTVRGSEADTQARAFAQELLLPREAMIEEMRSPVTLSNLAPLKPRWNVSLQMLIRRANGLRFITSNQYRYLNQWLDSA